MIVDIQELMERLFWFETNYTMVLNLWRAFGYENIRIGENGEIFVKKV